MIKNICARCQLYASKCRRLNRTPDNIQAKPIAVDLFKYLKRIAFIVKKKKILIISSIIKLLKLSKASMENTFGVWGSLAYSSAARFSVVKFKAARTDDMVNE